MKAAETREETFGSCSLNGRKSPETTRLLKSLSDLDGAN